MDEYNNRGNGFVFKPGDLDGTEPPYDAQPKVEPVYDAQPQMEYRSEPQMEPQPRIEKAPAVSKPAKKSGGSFAGKIGLAAVFAVIFGLVAGGLFLLISRGVGGPDRNGQGLGWVGDKDEDQDDEDIAALPEDKAEVESDDESEVEAETESDDESEDKSGDKADKDDEEDEVDEEDDDSTSFISSNKNSTISTFNYDVADIAEKVQPSIVSITTAGTETVQSYFQTYEQPTSGAGSGIIVGKDDDNLYIATNYHVIEDADEIKVGFNDDEVVSASVKGYDEDADIALVVVPLSDMKDSTKDAVTVASIGDSSAIRVGEPAIAIGNALGYGQSVTVGYISALERSITGSDGKYIQTDAAINPGNSGGALINSQGEVIGINSIKYVDDTVEGMGFAIPINEAMTIIDDIASGKQVAKSDLGIDGIDISKDYARIYGFPAGIYVRDIAAGSAAAASDLEVEDIIVEFDGEEVYTIDSLKSMVKNKSEGSSVEMVVYRQNDMGRFEQVTVDITISAE